MLFGEKRRFGHMRGKRAARYCGYRTDGGFFRHIPCAREALCLLWTGIGPDDLHIAELMQRLASGEVKEVLIATNPNVEGETTAAYLARLIKPLGVEVTRLASGLPVGGDLEFADEITLGRAIESRRVL